MIYWQAFIYLPSEVFQTDQTQFKDLMSGGYQAEQVDWKQKNFGSMKYQKKKKEKKERNKKKKKKGNKYKDKDKLYVPQHYHNNYIIYTTEALNRQNRIEKAE